MKGWLEYRVAEFFATFFYLGYVPWAPGTIASVVTTVIVFFLPHLGLM